MGYTGKMDEKKFTDLLRGNPLRSLRCLLSFDNGSYVFQSFSPTCVACHFLASSCCSDTSIFSECVFLLAPQIHFMLIFSFRGSYRTLQMGAAAISALWSY